ncbi:hypothetical protein FBZ94_110143 [Bradyrhizobium sacchari]|uniref:Uncharacterized protein n=1 Tax=Bradyrhizobium sacchari TaxID=1399419 RepID=A0A560HXD8_9BRAD|nr:hypothetical protein FBZ94_110143 [Bradyrhizobium sacchari]TWB69547.1 hypothetical protein FBZ95_109143 [Bradyrhizobium sacchari]
MAWETLSVSLRLLALRAVCFLQASLELIVRLAAKQRQHGLMIESGTSCPVYVNQRSSYQARIAYHQCECVCSIDRIGFYFA